LKKIFFLTTKKRVSNSTKPISGKWQDALLHPLHRSPLAIGVSANLPVYDLHSMAKIPCGKTASTAICSSLAENIVSNLACWNFLPQQGSNLSFNRIS
jgi:hypothetical protein